MKIPTDTIDDIVAMKTSALDLSAELERCLNDHLREIIGDSKEGNAFVKLEECASFIMNEANLSREQMARLIHWRQAHRQAGEGVIHENCPICEEGKRKTKGFKRNQLGLQGPGDKEEFPLSPNLCRRVWWTEQHG
jgi:hypothetical protein